MTAPDPKASEGDVTQEDRACAQRICDIVNQSLCERGYILGDEQPCFVLEHGPTVQAIAAHRLASLAAKEAETADLVRRVKHYVSCVEPQLAAAQSENQSLRQRVEGLSKGLREVQDFIWNLPQESACAAYAVADRLLEGTPYHVTAALSATVAAGKAEKT